MKYPNFFIVGEPKCGTTSLYMYLKQHSEIFMPEVKEPHFFCKDFHDESDLFHRKKKSFRFRAKDEYMQLFPRHIEEKVVGEASVHYAYSKIAAEEIFLFNPSAKIILMLRDPVEFVYSLHSEFVHQMMESNDFEQALLLESERKENWKNVNKNVATPSFVYYSERAEFSNHIQKFQNIFGSNNVKIILLDDLKENPLKVYKDTLRFLNVNDTAFIPDFKVINPNKQVRFAILRKLFLFFSNLSFRKIIPSKLRKYGKDKIMKATTVQKRRRPMSKKIERELRARYKHEVQKLSSILKRDLVKKWEY